MSCQNNDVIPTLTGVKQHVQTLELFVQNLIMQTFKLILILSRKHAGFLLNIMWVVTNQIARISCGKYCACAVLTCAMIFSQLCVFARRNAAEMLINVVDICFFAW